MTAKIRRVIAVVPLLLIAVSAVARLGSARLIGNHTFEQTIPLKGLKEKPKRAVIAYYDDILGTIEAK